ncbi:cytochrome P450 94A2 [Ziziphus jujuba]|uniref:Cytochrome P450 94A2 n=1 Tax=Ziziphus jujuba TaxID=326968 RepID=A0A6P4AZE4_ZIZJJ|nr:cytochrome P450 94A2 [Ziziphus jujuba]
MNIPPQLLVSSFLFILPLLFLFIFTKKKNKSSPNSTKQQLPKSYPLVGHYFSISPNQHRRNQYTTEVLQNSPAATFVFRHLFGARRITTANPAVVQHILKTNFSIYQKGDSFRIPLSDFLGDGIFNADGDNWKFQRQVASHEFNTKSLRKFIETVVETELSDRLLPILSEAASDNSVLDFQDILQRFAFDNICKIAFGFDPAYLSPSLPDAKFALAFDDAVSISSQRNISSVPWVWKIKKIFGIGSEKQLAQSISEVRDFATHIVREKKKELAEKSSVDSVDLLSRFLSSGHSDEKFVTDIVISFILAGKDTTSAALTWFFWLVAVNPHVEKQILKEINDQSETSVYSEVKEMVYTQAALCESMRLYPPVPADAKEAAVDDVLPDGTVVKKGDKVVYHPYAMGRMENVWGKDWAEYRPERWLEWNEESKKWSLVMRDSYTYPVFQAGPRICLGKEMAFLQMKRVVAGVLRRFRVVPAMAEGTEPVFISHLTSKMKGGFPVRFVERGGTE